MSFLCPHLIEQYFQKVAEILISYKPQIVFLVNYNDISEGLINRSVLRKEEHEDIIKIKNREKKVEKLLAIIPKRMWGLENFMTVLIDENINTWLAEELFKAYIRHLVDSIKKQQAERKCDCLKSGNSLLRRKWIQLLQIFDAWIYNVGASLGFVTTTLYPVESSLAFINKRLPLPRKRPPQLQWQNNSLFNSNSQSVIVTEVEDDVDEQMALPETPESNRNNGLMNFMPTTAVISRPIKALTNGLIITPLRAINGSLTRSVDRLSSLTSLNEPKPLMITYPEHNVSTGNLSEMAALSKKSTPLSRVTQKYFTGSNLNSSFENIPLKNDSSTSLSSSSTERIVSRPKINSFSSSSEKQTSRYTPPSSPISTTRVIRKSPITPKVSLVVNPMKSSISATKSSSPILKPPISPVKSSSQTNPSISKSAVSTQLSSATDSAKNAVASTNSAAKSSPKSTVETSNRLSGVFDTEIDHSGVIDVISEEPDCDSPNTRTVGTNTIFHYSTIQQPLKLRPPSNSQAKLSNTTTNAAAILPKTPLISLDDVENATVMTLVSSLPLSPTLALQDLQSTFTTDVTTSNSAISMMHSQDSINSVFSEASTSSATSMSPKQSLSNIPTEVAAEEILAPISKPVATTDNNTNAAVMSKSLSNLSKTTSLSTSSSKVSQDPKKLTNLSKKPPNGVKSLGDSSSLPGTPRSPKKGLLNKTISSVVDRLSKPKTVKTISEQNQEKNKTIVGSRISPGTKSLTNSPLFPRRTLSSSNKSPEVKAESLPNSKSTLNISTGVVKLKKVAKVSPSKPKFNTSTKYKPPPPPPSITYEPFSPEDYNFQMWSNEWVSRKRNDTNETGIH